MRHFLSTILLLAFAVRAQVRVKDAADVQGISVQKLAGYGLVVGLSGTGDGTGSGATVQSTVNLLRNMGMEVDPKQLRLRNAAAVVLTADLPPFAKPGQRIEVHASSLGDARSLAGGVLLMAPLKGTDGEIYALAQGTVGTGGSVTQSSGGSSFQRNSGATGTLPMGGIVQRENQESKLDEGPLRLTLRDPDFSSAQALALAISKELGEGTAVAEDATTVKYLGKDPPQGRAALVARIESLRFTPNRIARVVINERTGTIVAGADVRISEVAVTQGSLTVRIEAATPASQPAPLSMGTTQSATAAKIQSDEARSQMQVLPANSSVGELARTLNSLGATPRDLVAILQAIQKSGALQAELVLM